MQQFSDGTDFFGTGDRQRIKKKNVKHIYRCSSVYITAINLHHKNDAAVSFFLLYNDIVLICTDTILRMTVDGSDIQSKRTTNKNMERRSPVPKKKKTVRL